MFPKNSSRYSMLRNRIKLQSNQPFFVLHINVLTYPLNNQISYPEPKKPRTVEDFKLMVNYILDYVAKEVRFPVY